MSAVETSASIVDLRRLRRSDRSEIGPGAVQLISQRAIAGAFLILSACAYAVQRRPISRPPARRGGAVCTTERFAPEVCEPFAPHRALSSRRFYHRADDYQRLDALTGDRHAGAATLYYLATAPAFSPSLPRAGRGGYGGGSGTGYRRIVVEKPYGY